MTEYYVTINKVDAERASKALQMQAVKVRKQIFNGIAVANAEAIDDFRDYLREYFSHYSISGEADRYFDFDFKYRMMGYDADIYIHIIPKENVNDTKTGEFDGVGSVLLYGSDPHPITAQNAPKLIFQFGDVPTSYGRVQENPGEKYVGRGPVHHPGYRAQGAALVDELYKMCMSRISHLTVNKDAEYRLAKIKDKKQLRAMNDIFSFEEGYE